MRGWTEDTRLGNGREDRSGSVLRRTARFSAVGSQFILKGDLFEARRERLPLSGSDSMELRGLLSEIGSSRRQTGVVPRSREQAVC